MPEQETSRGDRSIVSIFDALRLRRPKRDRITTSVTLPLETYNSLRQMAIYFDTSGSELAEVGFDAMHAEFVRMISRESKESQSPIVNAA